VIILAAVSAYWFYVNQPQMFSGSSATSSLLTGPPLQGSDFFFNYSKCRVGDAMYIDFFVRNRENATVHYLNSSLTYDMFLFSNGTTIYSYQVHSDERPTVGSVGQWHIGVPVVGFWPNGTSVSSVKVTFAVSIQEINKTLSWTVTVPVLKTDPACPKS